MNLFLTPFQIRALFWSWLEGESLFLVLIWNLISLAPTSMCAFVVLRKGLPSVRGVFMSSCMSSTTKSTRTKKFHIFTGIFSMIPVG